MSAAEEYQATLNELNTTSKFEIDGLTMLAEENREYAVDIVSCIVKQLKRVEPKKKLPVLYLIDSICKNYPKSNYVTLFTQNIVSNFVEVFKESDEKTRRSLHKLRLTWGASKIFPDTKLEAIDRQVHKMDPKWPIIKTSVSTNDLQKKPQQPQLIPPIPVQQPTTQIQSSDNQNQLPQLSQAERSALNLQQDKGTKRSNSGGNRRKKQKVSTATVKLNNNGNNLPIADPTVLLTVPQFMDPNIIQATHDISQQVHPSAYLDPSISISPNDHIHSVPGAAAFIDPNVIALAPLVNDGPIANQHLYCAPFNPATNPLQPQAQQNPQSSHQAKQNQLQEDPETAHMFVLEKLYGGKQCSNCSLRFDDNNRYASHLDWHFRQNLKSDCKTYARRKWYYPLDLWVKFREINDDELQENTNISNNNTDNNTNDSAPIPVGDHEVPTAPASKEDEKNICSVCHETFEKFYDVDEDEWRLRNAQLYEDERVYHPLCLMDMLQANSSQTVETGDEPKTS